MKKNIFLRLPFSFSAERKYGVRYCKAIKVENGIGYFEKNEFEFHCKTVNDFFTVGNIMVEKCTYDTKGCPINKTT